MRSTSVAFLLVTSLLIAGCTSGTRVQKTNLSVLELGASRDQVEAALGEPVKVHSDGDNQVAVYGYNKGGPHWPDVRRVEFQALVLFPVVAGEAAYNWSKQRGELEVTYDSNQKVIWYRSKDQPWLEIRLMAERDGYKGQFYCGMKYSKWIELSPATQTRIYETCSESDPAFEARWLARKALAMLYIGLVEPKRPSLCLAVQSA